MIVIDQEVSGRNTEKVDINTCEDDYVSPTNEPGKFNPASCWLVWIPSL
jgi:hypothetical protein